MIVKLFARESHLPGFLLLGWRGTCESEVVCAIQSDVREDVFLRAMDTVKAHAKLILQRNDLEFIDE